MKTEPVKASLFVSNCSSLLGIAQLSW